MGQCWHNFSADGAWQWQWSPLEMAVLTVSLAAQHLWPFILVPNFSSIICSTVPIFNASCPRVAPTSAPIHLGGGLVWCPCVPDSHPRVCQSETSAPSERGGECSCPVSHLHPCPLACCWRVIFAEECAIPLDSGRLQGLCYRQEAET